MSKITIQSFAKVNLSLDVKGLLDNGFHIVEMVMQQISLHDHVHVEWQPSENTSKTSESDVFEINLTTSRDDLPVDRGNLAYRAAELMNSEFPGHKGKMNIHIDKKIPVAAGMAGGSSNCAAVIHGINQLWNLGLSVSELNILAAKLGSDIPFCIMGQAAASEVLADHFAKDPMACHCALATGTGTDLLPLPSLDAYIALSKPPIAVSTAEVYKGIDNQVIESHPNNEEMIQGLKVKDNVKVFSNMVNVLENYTLKVYSNVMYTKDKMASLHISGPVLMSGSGPTVFAVCESLAEADTVTSEMVKHNDESYSVMTTSLMQKEIH